MNKTTENKAGKSKKKTAEKTEKKEVKVSKTTKINKDNFAVIETGGRQFLVYPGMKLKVAKLKSAPGSAVSFDKVLLVSVGSDLKIGAPYVFGASISAEFSGNVRGEKIEMARYKSKTRRLRRQGHRQEYSEVVIGDF
jgi:large subunit ribosomal protein L21